LKVLGISGSPRLGGNTDTLLQEVLKGAESLGAETKTIFICDKRIAPCEHCDNCLVLGDCKIPDDMHEIYKQMSEADAIVIASPVHFLGLTAQLKAAVDRCQALWARKYKLKMPPLEEEKKRRGLFVSTGGRTAAGNFEPAIATVKALFATLDMEYEGALTFPGVDKKGEILKNEDALKQAYEAGVKLAT
jgi:multimeric flavodoxin WrbA